MPEKGRTTGKLLLFSRVIYSRISETLMGIIESSFCSVTLSTSFRKTKYLKIQDTKYNKLKNLFFLEKI